MLAASATVAATGAVVAGLTSSGAAALGYVAGVALVAASYTATTLAVAWADSIAPRLVLPVGMAVFAVKFGLLALLLLALPGSAWPGKTGFVAGVIAGVVGWIAAQIWWIVHCEYPYRSGP